MTVSSVVATAALLPTGGLTLGWALTRCRVHRLHREIRALRKQASDSVTSGPTRAAWESVACARLAAPESTVVLIADLDEFKAINDEHGHLAGDVVLQTVAERLTATFANDDGEVCRLGGDEFGVIATDSSAAENLTALAETLTAPVPLPTGERVSVGVSVGCYRAAYDEAPSLRHALEVADEQMLGVKRRRHDAARG